MTKCEQCRAECNEPRIKESDMELRMKDKIDDIDYDEFLDLYNIWFSTSYIKANVNWDINGPK